MDFAALQHSLFLQALGSAILNSLWQCFILWLIYETFAVSYKSASARFKNNLSSLLLFVSFAWFLTSLIYKILDRSGVVSATVLSKDFALEPAHGIHAVSGFSTFLSYASGSLPYLSVAYIFLLFFLISRLFAAYRYVYFISNKRLISPAKELQLFACRVAFEIGIAKKISVWISHHIDVPATIGFIKPVILIPFASINNLSASQLEAIILHELAHIKRNDYITNIIISVIETILFFNPFVVLLSGVIKRERENCCDDFVLQYRYDPHSYAYALLRLEQSRTSKLKLAINAVSGKKQLLSRIKRITNCEVVSRQFNYGQKMIAFLLVTAIICSVAWLAPEEKNAIPAKSFAKEVTPAPVLKTKSTVKPQQTEEVTTIEKAIENLAAIAVKHFSPKNEPGVPETDIENLLQSSSADDSDEMIENKDNQKDNKNFFKADNYQGYPETINNLPPPPRFHFDEKNIKLPQAIKIQNFPFQNLNVNIELSKIDMEKLNESLNLAYKQLNGFDWNKIKNEIRKSFPKMKSSNFSKEQDAFLYNDKAKILSNLNMMHAQQQYNSKADLDQLLKAMMMDSLHTAEVAVCNDNESKIQDTYKKMQRRYERIHAKHNYSGDNYYYNYSNNNAAIAAPETDEDEANAKNSVTAKTSKKTVNISIIRTSSHTGVLNEKKPIQFSFGNDDERSNRENVIRVEIGN